MPAGNCETETFAVSDVDSGLVRGLRLGLANVSGVQLELVRPFEGR